MTSPTLKQISRQASEELVRQGVHTFDVAARKLFDFDRRETLIVHPDADLAHKRLARLALQCDHCKTHETGVSLRQSFKLTEGASLLYATGARLLLGIKVRERGSSPVCLGFVLYMKTREGVVEPEVSAAFRSLPRHSLYIELVCGAPRTGTVSLLLLKLLGRLHTGKTVKGLLAKAVNTKSVHLFERHGYETPTLRSDIFFLSRANALYQVAKYEQLLLVDQRKNH